MTIYIAGPITGMPEGNRKAFDDAEELLYEQGHVVFNPQKLPRPYKGLTDPEAIWQHYMRLCLPILISCDSIYMLPHWQNSKGAVWEHRIAEMLGLEMLYAPVPDEQVRQELVSAITAFGPSVKVFGAGGGGGGSDCFGSNGTYFLHKGAPVSFGLCRFCSAKTNRVDSYGFNCCKDRIYFND